MLLFLNTVSHKFNALCFMFVQQLETIPEVIVEDLQNIHVLLLYLTLNVFQPQTFLNFNIDGSLREPNLAIKTDFPPCHTSNLSIFPLPINALDGEVHCPDYREYFFSSTKPFPSHFFNQLVKKICIIFSINSFTLQKVFN